MTRPKPRHIATAGFCISLAACGPSNFTIPETDSARAPREYRCTVDQMSRVETETRFCNEQGGYFQSACYGFAIMRNCQKAGTTEAP